MDAKEPLIRNISDTARWVAAYRAHETERPDAVFSDPYARRLAGDRGEEIAKAMPFKAANEWPFVARTYLYDQFVNSQVRQGVDMVINLAAGLDARPYRLDLPSKLKWVEVDLPCILDYKEGILANEKPRCSLDRVRLDLSDVSARKKLFGNLGEMSRKALIMTEGLLAYLSPDEVGALALDLGAQPSFQGWLADFGSPGLMAMMNKQMGDKLKGAGGPFKFSPPEGPPFFTRYGWKPSDVRSLLRCAAQLKRLPLFLRIIALFPDSNGAQGKRPWSAVCLLTRQ
ncbi:MAG: SAM-dependent methyltransferase [Candidatus Acidiferrales bacterium]